MTYYEVTHAYWKDPHHVELITDDLLYAREHLLRQIMKQLDSIDRRMVFKTIEQGFQEFISDGKTLYVSVRDYHFSLRHAQTKIVIGGLSTIPRST